jgi:hypothetical protein
MARVYYFLIMPSFAAAFARRVGRVDESPSLIGSIVVAFRFLFEVVVVVTSTAVFEFLLTDLLPATACFDEMSSVGSS